MYRYLFSLLLIAGNTLTAQQLTVAQLELKPVVVNKYTSVKDQYMSSTCWSFASNSFIESEMMRQGIIVPDLSEMFVARYSYLNKIRTHLQTNGASFFTPGGQYHDVLKVIEQYGIVPETVYSGLLPGKQNHNHAALDTLVAEYVRELTAKKQTRLSSADLTYLNGLFDTHLGKVPADFMYAGKKYTPVSFAKKVLRFNSGDYIEITSYSQHPWYTSFVLEDKYNWSSDQYYNVPTLDFLQIIDSALLHGFTVCWDGDVTETGFQYQDGLAVLDTSLADYTNLRQTSYTDKSSQIDHMMHITGLYRDKDNRPWYYVKNSWGLTTNEQEGFVYMNKAYLAVKTIAIIVHKDAIPITIRRKLGL